MNKANNALIARKTIKQQNPGNNSHNGKNNATPPINNMKQGVKLTNQVITVTSASSKVNSNYQTNNQVKVNNFVTAQVADSAKKAQDIKKLLKIKNFFEITKLSELKANTDRAHYNQENGTKSSRPYEK